MSSRTEDYVLEPDGWHSLVDDHLVQGVTPSPERVFGDPGVGNVYWGQTNLAGNGNTHPANQPRETYYGKRVGVNRTYWNQGTADDAVAAIAADLAKGRVAWPSFKLTTQTAAQFGAGPAAWFGNMLSDIDAIQKGPVLLTLEHEFNTTTSTPTDAANHLAMYTAAKALTDLYPQILLTPCMLAGYDLVNRLGFKFEPWIGQAWDVAAWDTYNRMSWNLDGTTSPITLGGANGKKFLTVQQLVGLQVAQIKALRPNGMWAVGEWGVRTDPNTPGRSAQFMTDLFDYARANNGFALSFFDSGTNVNDGGSPWFLDDRDTERLVRFKSILTGAHSAFIPPGGLPKP